ncbi:MAG: hypothetical protein KF745_04380 [Phycisphaeraceae bacterium]|nr:hypothetical protein [Phycisphaeraceae bacterium]
MRSPTLPRHARRVAILLSLAGLALSTSAAQAQNSARSAAASSALTADALADDSLPIRRITLYRSGVGFFQRDGAISGDTKVQLRFKIDQVNDILKSLVLLDLGGGRIDAVSYASKDPLDRRLASFGINIADNPSAGEILSRLRGTPVSLTTPGGQVSGTVMNVERRPTVFPGSPGSQTSVHDLPWINLITPAGIRSVDLTSVSGFSIDDRSLADELSKALAALAEYRAENAKTVDLSFSGDGSRRVVVAYVHEMPVWKTSYRLILPDSSGSAAIHGWAIVENTTDQDWTDVRLSLVAGRPVSFQMDLYEPLYAPRPTIPVPMVAGVMPRQYQLGANMQLLSAMERAADREVLADAAPAPAAAKSVGGQLSSRAGRGFVRAENEKELRTAYGVSLDDMRTGSAAAQAQGTEVGEIFQYELANPVTIERQRSAMIPIVTSPVQARRVSIFNITDGSDHPMRGVEVKNTTDLQLLPGPIAVFEGSSGGSGEGSSSYAGDAEVGHIPPGATRLLAYAVDLDVQAITKPESTQTVSKVRIVDGVFEQTIKQRNSITYAFDNKDLKRARTVLVESPRLPGWDLSEPKKPLETTQNLYRFEIPLEPGKTGSLSVIQERTDLSRAAITSFDLATLLAWRQDGKLSEDALKAFRDAAARQSLINDSERAIAEIDREVQSISQDQGRIRENMKTVDRNTDLYRRYATKLNDQESSLEALATRRADEQTRLEQRRRDLATFLKGLNVD